MHFKYLSNNIFYRDDYNATYSNDVTKFFCWLNFIIEVCFLLVKILLKISSTSITSFIDNKRWPIKNILFIV